jgi:N-methylhydantoinase B/oxoprolinase/acetone carboxylase alpha subunit
LENDITSDEVRLNPQTISTWRVPGINRVVRLDGTVEDLGHIGQAEMQVGDVFEIHTPGGGGFGTG